MATAVIQPQATFLAWSLNSSEHISILQMASLASEADKSSSLGLKHSLPSFCLPNS